MSRIFRPTHAYIPGKTARHPEGAFDALKSDVTEGMNAEEMQKSLAWKAGVFYRAEGYYWECHEVLEALWLAAPDGPVRSYVQAVIQLANAQLKEKMNRPRAVVRLCGIVATLLDECGDRHMVLGQSVAGLRSEAKLLSAQNSH